MSPTRSFIIRRCASVSVPSLVPKRRSPSHTWFHNGGLRPSCMLSALPHECMQVRTMLLFQKAVSEGGRSMVYECAKLVDKMTDCERAGDHKGAKEVRSDASDGLWPLMASDGL